MKGNTVAIIVAVVVLVAVAAVAYFAVAYFAAAGKSTQGSPSIGVSENEINSIGQYSDLNLPSDVGSDENVPDPESTIVVDENDVSLDLPSDI